MGKKLTQEEVIARFIAVHGDKYEYLDDYEKQDKPIRIRCKKHDRVFMQTPVEHWRGHGCPLCGREITESAKRLTLVEFIERSNEVHGNKYDYTPSEYINGRTKTTIICPVHGPFEQTPEMHMAGQGCPDCGGTRRLTTDEFKKRVIEKFGDIFDLSEVDYKNNMTHVTITCSKGHRFERTPNDFMNSDYGCPICGNIAKNESKFLATQDFILKSRAVHGDRFDYSKSEYKDCRTEVCIICPIHGEFWQRPTIHYQGCGCPKCTESRGEYKISTYLDTHAINYIKEYRIIPNQVLFGRNTFYVDFYLPDHNIFIEFHGEQHYRRVRAWHSDEQFEFQQDRDRRLREYCKRHKIRLIEIPYTEIENIDKILNKKVGS